MARLTLRLPDTLHQQLEALARNESVSLNHYIVYALTRQTTLAYTVSPIPESQVSEQRAAYTALLQGLGPATFAEVEQTLAKRERAKPEQGLTPHQIKALKKRMKAES